MDMLRSFRRLGFLILFSLSSFLFLELFLNFANPPALRYYRDVKLLHAYHPEYGVTLAPNENRFVRHYADLWQGQFTTNSLGLRGKEEPNPNLPKLVCLGDSMVMGFGVSDEDTFCSLLNGIQIKGKTYQSLNFGVDAYGSLGSYKRLLDMSEKISDIQEVLFFVSPNDFTMPEELRAQGILPDDESDALHENDLVWKKNFKTQFELTRVSFLIHALKLAYEQTKVKLLITKYSIQTDLSLLFEQPTRYFYDTFFVTTKKESCNSIESSFECPGPVPGLHITCTDKPDEPSSLPPLGETTTRAYDSMIALANKKGMRLTPVFLPMQIEEVYCRQLGKFNSLGNYATRAKLYFESKGVKTIDLLPSTDKMCGRSFVTKGIEKKAVIQDYYIPGDGHLTKIGNLWAKESIVKELTK